MARENVDIDIDFYKELPYASGVKTCARCYSLPG